MLGSRPLGTSLLTGVSNPVNYAVLPNYSPSVITAVSHIQQGLSVPQFVIGGRGGSGQNTHWLLKKSTIYGFNLWQSEKFLIGMPFSIKRIDLQLTSPIASGITLIPVLRFDDGSTATVGTSITSTNYSNSENKIVLRPDNFNFAVRGNRNFFLELQFWGSGLIGVAMPIDIIIETENVG